jgi:exodeoxyribonuclease V alpha subunit
LSIGGLYSKIGCGNGAMNLIAFAIVSMLHSNIVLACLRRAITLRVGDRVIQKVNDYNREVFNGDLGVIRVIDKEEQEITVEFSDRIVSYDYADLNEITLAFATTIHKAQGSEYPVVILPLFMSHYLMLSRNLLYTGLTRAKQLAILVGSPKAIGLAVRQVKDSERYTMLAQRLRNIAASLAS